MSGIKWKGTVLLITDLAEFEYNITFLEFMTFK
jgi:hypothetical protein